MFNRYISEQSQTNLPYALMVMDIVDATEDVDMMRFLCGLGQ